MNNKENTDDKEDLNADISKKTNELNTEKVFLNEVNLDELRTKEIKPNKAKNISQLKKDVKRLNGLINKMSKLIKIETKNAKLLQKLKSIKNEEFFENHSNLAAANDQYLIYLKKERAIFEQKCLNVKKIIDNITI
ncbi:MAG: hypothetical protein ACRDAW_00315 [Metamycoplasmataceae bacterium]